MAVCDRRRGSQGCCPAYEDQVGVVRHTLRHHWHNPELAKKNPRCLECIVVHELVHFRERDHGPRFVDLMDQYLPDWRSRRDELNGAPLADEDWTEHDYLQQDA